LKYDSLDVKIIGLLQEDGRKPFAKIARQLDISAGVVQARYSKMKEAGLIAGSTLIVNLSKIGINFTASIGIVARESQVEEVKRYLEGLKIENCRHFVWTAFGKYNIAMAVFLRNSKDAFKVRNMIRLHPGVQSVEMSLGKDVSYNIQHFDIERILE
jgi:Lrp/AsnC family transcriptional regulator for asnA, asnC and gidA